MGSMEIASASGVVIRGWMNASGQQHTFSLDLAGWGEDKRETGKAIPRVRRAVDTVPSSGSTHQGLPRTPGGDRERLHYA